MRGGELLAHPSMGGHRHLTPAQQVLTVVAVGSLIVAAVGAYLLIGQPRPTTTEMLFSGTVSVAPGGGTVQEQLPPMVSGPSKVLLTLETPSRGQPFPENLSVTLGSNANPSWVWPASLGSWGLVGSTPPLVSTNGSQVVTLSLPRSTIVGGSASIMSVSGPLVSPYSLTFSVGSELALTRNSSAGWLPFSQLSWTQTGNGSIALTSAQMPNGTSVLGLGESTGFLDVFSYTPGSPGELVFRADISAPDPLSVLCAGDLSNQGIPTILAAAGPVVSVITPSQGGVWSQHPILVDPFSNKSPSVQAMVAAPMNTGASSIVVSTDASTLEISNWSNGGTGVVGWSPFQRLATLPSDSNSVASALSPTGTTWIAAADDSGVSLFSLNHSGMLGSQLVGLPNGVHANGVALNSTGLGLLIAGSDGILYRATWPTWTVTPVMLPDGGRAILSVVMERATPGDIALASVGDNRVFVVVDPFSAPNPLATTDSLPTGNDVGFLAIGSIFGRSEPDLLALSGTGVWSAEAEQMFQSAAVAGWTTDLQGALSQLSPSIDAYGNALVDVPLALTVHGGAAELENPMVLYNASIVVDVTKDIATAVSASRGSGGRPQLVIDEGTPGSIHVELTAYYKLPQSTAQIIGTFFATNIVLLLGGVLLSGVVLVAGGGWMYGRKGAGNVPPHGGPKKAPSPER